jgi:LPS-assembly lipoprotein
MSRFNRAFQVGLLAVVALALAGCGFHLRRSAALPAPMQHQVYLQVGGGEFARSLAAALRAGGVDVLDEPAAGVPTLAIPTAAFSSHLLGGTGYQKVGQYVVGFHVRFTLTAADGTTLIPTQTIDLSHEFAVDQTQFSAISSETQAIQRSLVREMTDAVMRRQDAHAQAGTVVAPAPAASAG